jgi:hypothetical protein
MVFETASVLNCQYAHAQTQHKIICLVKHLFALPSNIMTLYSSCYPFPFLIPLLLFCPLFSLFFLRFQGPKVFRAMIVTACAEEQLGLFHNDLLHRFLPASFSLRSLPSIPLQTSPKSREQKALRSRLDIEQKHAVNTRRGKERQIIF